MLNKLLYTAGFMKGKEYRVAHRFQFWEKYPRALAIASLLGLGAISVLAFLWQLGSIGLVDETEPLFAEAARQMTVTGDWITPFFNGETRFDKPPLVYWLMALGYHLIGVNEWAVRLPSALAAIALTALGFYTLRHFGFPNPPTFRSAAAALTANDISELETLPPRSQRQLWLSAWIGGALIALNAETIVWARTGVSDMLLSGCMGTALFCFFWGYTRPARTPAQWRWYLACYGLTGLAILTKGPIGVVIPALVIGSFLLYVGQFRTVWCEMRPLRWGLPILLAISLPWYLLVIQAHGIDYISSFFGYHNLERFTRVVNRHSAPWYFYFLVVLVGFAPLSVYLPLAIARLRIWQRSRWQTQPRANHLGLFALFWFVSIFGFFTLSATKLPSYVLPLMPAAAILIGLLWSDRMTRQATDRDPKSITARLSRYGLYASAAINLLLLFAMALAAFLSPNLIGYDPVAPKFPEALQQSQLHLIAGSIWLTSAIAAALLWWRNRLRWLWAANLIGFIAFVTFTFFPLYDLMDRQRQMPLRELAAIAVQTPHPCDPTHPCPEILNIGFNKPTLVFYSQQPVTHFTARVLARAHLEQNATDPTQSPTLLIIMQAHKFPKLLREINPQPDEHRIIAQRGAYILAEVSRKAFAKPD